MDRFKHEVSLIKKASAESEVYSKKYLAQLAMFEAACMENNGMAADAARQEMHSLIDHILDCNSTIQLLKRQISDLL